jgi:hypothetical protein
MLQCLEEDNAMDDNTFDRTITAATTPLGTDLSRRRLLRLSAGALGALSAGAVGFQDLTPARAAGDGPVGDLGGVPGALNGAYTFLDTMMDVYTQGSTLRLAQSYSDQQGLNSTAFTYDNALQIIAYLGRGRSSDRLRAALLGDSLLYAQAHDPAFSDGRLRDSYFVSPALVTASGTVQLDGPPAFLNGSAVGNIAWAGLALARLYRSTGSRRFLDGALKLGAWIVNNAFDTRGAGGYTGGVDGGNNPLLYKSTEHNIDTCALFSALARFAGSQIYPGLTKSWATLAAYAASFIATMWNSSGQFFYTGTNPDGVTTNPSPIPEDVQTWSFLALRDPRFAQSVDWARGNLAATDTAQAYNSTLTGNLSFQGVTFSSVSRHPASLMPPNSFTPGPDPDGVWFEGTAHLITALLARNAGDNLGGARDGDTAMILLRNLLAAQAQLGQNQTAGGKSIPNGLGLVASSSPLDTGFGFDYFPNLHIGATSWYAIAAQQVNPFQFDQN